MHDGAENVVIFSEGLPFETYEVFHLLGIEDFNFVRARNNVHETTSFVVANYFGWVVRI